MGRPLSCETGSVVYNCCWASPLQSFLGPSYTPGICQLPCHVENTGSHDLLHTVVPYSLSRFFFVISFLLGKKLNNLNLKKNYKYNNYTRNLVCGHLDLRLGEHYIESCSGGFLL
jgi:hypothetical protein